MHHRHPRCPRPAAGYTDVAAAHDQGRNLPPGHVVAARSDKPVQTPYPPIILGGTGPTVEDRILAFGDGWVPGIAGMEDEVFDRFARLQGRTDKPLELTASGPDEHDCRTLTRLRERGADRVLVWLPQNGPGGGISNSETERFLDDLVANAPS